MINAPDNRSPKAVAYQWATRIMSVSLEMVVPGLIGYWLDQKLQTTAIFTLLGFVLGMVLGMWHLLRMTAAHTDDKGDTQEKQ